MTIDTWVSLGGLLAVLLSLGGLVLGQTASLRKDARDLRSELKAEITGLRTELKADLADMAARVDVLDGRIYGLALEQARHFGQPASAAGA